MHLIYSFSLESEPTYEDRVNKRQLTKSFTQKDSKKIHKQEVKGLEKYHQLVDKEQKTQTKDTDNYQVVNN